MLVNEILLFLDTNSISYEYIGNNERLKIEEIRSLENLCENSMTWIKEINQKNLEKLNGFDSVLIICNNTNVIERKGACGYIVCDSPRDVFFMIVKEMSRLKDYSSKSTFSNNSENYVIIGVNSIIGPDVKLGHSVKIGNNVVLEGVIVIGNEVTIGSNTVIGTQGFGFFNNPKGEKERILHLGGVIIEDNVEIGSNTTIDRGTIDNTVIKSRVKISNNCALSHNVFIGENTLITSGTIITGGAKIGKDVYIGPGALIRNQIIIGDNSFIGMGSVVVEDVIKNSLVFGVPAKFVKFRE